ncbi:tryptophan 2,3-dioxygenase [Lentzea tibetensis]|uniref:Tryptophan 2,3-dioxygenase n=1 Tax=Lentzea tibetensis TaxID=2591470 RepID=A0A563ENC5_9PSEU|nr:tryptophan 2,3-dioxygenase [Lentzea tibetensis]TWP48813.1 tryptophan 2,3-dioxygenase [Lentzea tibetensis]
MSTAELRSWLRAPAVKSFPYGAVVREYHSAGKHFVSPELLEMLSGVRDMLPELSGPWPNVQTLASFLTTALDKPDKRYDYPSYLALALLQLPGPDDPVEQAPFARTRCDRLTAQLVADALAFEVSALDGRTTLLPQLRPAEVHVGKRFRHGLRVIRPALARMALDTGLTATEPGDLARQACAAVHDDMSYAERRALELSILPVYTMHDEYLFLRVLQTFETTFSLLATQIRGAIAAIGDGEIERAVHFVNSSETALRESAPLFSMLATMQIESFRTFRDFTEGASAIQSRNYKLVESLCRTPDTSRVDSPAYRSVPDVRERVLGSQPTLDEAYRELCASDVIAEDALKPLSEAMSAFARALLRWRQTHYRLAVRMLGEATGTGYTEGTPYLAAVRDIPVFHAVDTETTGAP